MRGRGFLPALLAAGVMLAGSLTAGGCILSGQSSSQRGLEEYRAGNYAKAGQLFREAITLEGEKSALYVSLGMSHLAMNAADEALKAFEHAIDLGGSGFYAARGAGLALLRKGEAEQAVSWFDYAAAQPQAKDGLRMDLLGYRAGAKELAGDIEGALDDYREMISAGYRVRDMHQLMGDVCARAGRYRDALEEYQQCLDINSRDYDAYLQMAAVMREAGGEEEAGVILNAALEVIPNGAQDLCSRGRVLLELGENDAAMEAFGEAADKGFRKARLYQGSCLELAGDREAAFVLYQDYILKYADDAEGYNRLGLWYLDSGAFEDARIMFEKALSFADAPLARDIRWNECMCLERSGSTEEALQALISFCQAYPQDEAGARELSFLRSRQHR